MAAQEADRGEEMLELVTFCAGGEEFGVDILGLREIHRVLEITRPPSCPEFADGVVHLRGEMIPVVDLGKRFASGTVERGRAARIVVVELRRRTVGFLVDSVEEVLRIPRSAVEPPPAFVEKIDEDCVEAVARVEDRLLILLDLQKFLIGAEARQLEAFEV